MYLPTAGKLQANIQNLLNRDANYKDYSLKARIFGNFREFRVVFFFCFCAGYFLNFQIRYDIIIMGISSSFKILPIKILQASSFFYIQIFNKKKLVSETSLWLETGLFNNLGLVTLLLLWIVHLF